MEPSELGFNVETARVETPRVETPRVETARIETTRVETARRAVSTMTMPLQSSARRVLWPRPEGVAAEDTLNHMVSHTSFLNSDAEMMVVLTSF